MDYVRFRRGATSLFYDGHRYGASLEIFPRDKQGFSGSFGYERFSFEKLISDLNDLPLNTLNQDEMKAEIAYTSFRNNHQWGIRTRATYQNRQGIESLIGSASTNVYEKTGEAEQLSVKKADLSLSGVYGQTKGNRFTWYLSPKAGFNSFKMEYIDPARLMKINYLYGGMNLFAAAGYKKSSFQLVLDRDVSQELDRRLATHGNRPGANRPGCRLQGLRQPLGGPTGPRTSKSAGITPCPKTGAFSSNSTGNTTPAKTTCTGKPCKHIAALFFKPQISYTWKK